jgi:Fe-S-cluster containining protein
MLTDKEKSDLCLGCLKCCTLLRIPYAGDVSRESVSFYSARGMKFVEVMEGGRRRIYLTFEHKCPQLTNLGCKIYPVRPRSCRLFDGSKDWQVRDACLWNK